MSSTLLMVTLMAISAPATELPQNTLVLGAGVAAEDVDKIHDELAARGAASVEVEVGGLADWINNNLPAVMFSGSPDFLPCEDPEPLYAPMELEDAREKIDFMDYGDAVVMLDDLASNLPCQTEMVERESLANLFFLQGFSRFFMGDQDRARAEFRQALSLDRKRKWDKDYPDDPYHVFLDAGEELRTSDPAFVSLEFQEGELFDLLLDGTVEVFDGGHRTEVTPGWHLIQWTVDGMLYETRWWFLRPGDEFRVLGRGAAAADLQKASDDPELAQWVSEMLRLGGLDRRVVVLSMEDEEAPRGDVPGFLYDPTTGFSGPLATATDIKEQKQREAWERDPNGSMQDHGRLSIGWGVIALTNGGAETSNAARGFLYAHLSANLEIRFGGAIGLGVDGAVGLRSYTSSAGVSETILLPIITAYPFLRLARGKVQPTLGIGAIFAFDQPGPLPKVSGQVDDVEDGQKLLAPGVAVRLDLTIFLRSPTGPFLRIGGQGGAVSLRPLLASGVLDKGSLMPFGAATMNLGARF